MIILEEIRHDLGGASEDARFMAWMNLYQSEEKEAKEEIQRILKGKDPVLKILFTRFLSHIDEVEAVAKLAELLQDENAVVVEAAKKAFEKNRFGQKLTLLLPLLKSPVRVAKLFAVEKIALSGVMQAIDGLIALMKDADKDLLNRLLSALRHFPVRKVSDVVIPYLADPREDIRFRAVLVLGACYEAGSTFLRRPLLRALSDPSQRVRQTVLWCLRKRPSPKDLPILFSISTSDPDSVVREESLLGLAAFPNPKVIRHLLRILVTEKDRMVILEVEGVLMSLPTPKLVRGLKSALTDPEEKVRSKALVLMAEFQQNSPEYFDRISDEFHKATHEREKLPLIEALGLFEDPRAIPLLEEVLRGSFVTAYAAMGSILKISRRQNKLTTLKYLEDERLSVLLRQMVLKEMLRRGAGENLPDNMRGKIEALLKDNNINIRYLSAQILLQGEGAASLGSLLEILLREKDPAILKHLREGLCNRISSQLSLAAALLASNRERGEVVSLIFSLMVPIDGVSQGGLLELLDLALTLPDRVPLMALLVERLSQIQNFGVSLPSSVVQKWLQEGDPEQKDLFIALMGVCGDRDMIPTLVSIGCNPSMSRHHDRVAEALGRVMKGGAS